MLLITICGLMRFASLDWRLLSHLSIFSKFSKHATCTSTFDVACYSDYQEHQETIDFTETVLK